MFAEEFDIQFNPAPVAVPHWFVILAVASAISAACILVGVLWLLLSRNVNRHDDTRDSD